MIPIVFKEIKDRKLQTIKEETFQKDEYCRRTYSKSFVEDYEKKLVGRNENDEEYIELVDIFYSPKNNGCFAVYDYYYINLKKPLLDKDGNKIDINRFEKRIAKAINAGEIVDAFELGFLGGGFKAGEKEKYDNTIIDLKSKN